MRIAAGSLDLYQAYIVFLKAFEDRFFIKVVVDQINLFITNAIGF